MLIVSDKIQIPFTEFELSFAKSSGPGGQNVNKVSSKAVLRWNLLNSTSISSDVRERFLARFANRITKNFEVIITSDRFRDQIRNQEDCLQKLCQMLLEVSSPPKLRLNTKPTYSSKLKTAQKKQMHGEKKQLRRKPKFED